MKSESTIWKALINNDYDCIEDLVRIDEMNIRNLHGKKSTKELKYLYLGNQSLIKPFIDYYEYITFDNDPIVYDSININNDDFNDLRMKYYYNFRRLREAGLVNNRQTSKKPS